MIEWADVIKTLIALFGTLVFTIVGKILWNFLSSAKIPVELENRLRSGAENFATINAEIRNLKESIRDQNKLHDAVTNATVTLKHLVESIRSLDSDIKGKFDMIEKRILPLERDRHAPREGL